MFLVRPGCPRTRLLRHTDTFTDRDCALLLSVVQNILQTAILKLPEEAATMQTKIDAVSAINKVRPLNGVVCRVG